MKSDAILEYGADQREKADPNSLRLEPIFPEIWGELAKESVPVF
jgi:hypothetical protein